MKKTMKKIGNIASTVLVVVMVLCAVFLMGSRLLGFQVFTVISGSMEPSYSVGDLIYVKKADPSTIQVGDPITFILNENLVVATHRVIRVDAENQHFYTQGEAPAQPEQPVTTDLVTTDPVATEPAAPVTNEPASTEPASTEPASTEPASTEPASTEPVTPEATPSEPQETTPATNE